MISNVDEDLDKYTVCKVSKGTYTMRVLCFYTWGKYFQEVFITKIGVSGRLTINLEIVYLNVV